MTTADRRLEVLTTGLTARERAILPIGCWNRGEEPAERLIKYMPHRLRSLFALGSTAPIGHLDDSGGKLSVPLREALLLQHSPVSRIRVDRDGLR